MLRLVPGTPNRRKNDVGAGMTNVLKLHWHGDDLSLLMVYMNY
jgi:hypothetical protein